ncbi:MAG TPA: DUF3592 domain-containing protein [Stellaceae bacterium]|nr:DUF3592 domain-containing protein [Stellaceae bacterium]
MVSFLGSAFTVVGLIALPIGIYGRRRARREQAWPTVKATVRTAAIASAPGSEGRRFIPKLTYEYTVAGKTYAGDRVGYTQYRDFSEAYARDYLAKHAVGSAVEVHYDPADPARSILEPGAGGCGPLLFSLVGVVFLAAGIAMLIAGT